MSAHKGQIPGLYSSDKSVDWSSDNLGQDNQNNASDSMNMDSSQTQNSKSVLNEMRHEKDNLGLNFIHSHRLLDAEISKVQHGSLDFNSCDPNAKLSEKIFVSLKDQKQHNLVGRLLGPKGVTLKRIQAETQTKISILGRGSMRDKKKEEELANSNEPGFEHLKDPLHILIEANPPYSNVKLSASVAEIRKMLIPLAPGAQDLVVAKFLDPMMAGGGGPPGGGGYLPREGLLPSPMDGEHGGGYGRGGSGRGGVGRGRGGAPRGAARGVSARGVMSRGRGRGGVGLTRGGPRGGAAGTRGSSRGGAGERGGRGRPRGGGGGYGESGYGSGREAAGGYGGGDGSGGGPIRTRSTSTAYDRMSDYKPETNVGYGSDYDNRGYGDREESSYRRSDHASNTVSDADPYYSSFSDSPSRGYSRDYNHGSGDGDLGASDWKSRSRSSDYRHHPYQQSTSYGY